MEIFHRLCIAIDFASIIEYLHQCIDYLIIRKYLNVGNVLRDGEMTTRVGDLKHGCTPMQESAGEKCRERKVEDERKRGGENFLPLMCMQTRRREEKREWRELKVEDREKNISPLHLQACVHKRKWKSKVVQQGEVEERRGRGGGEEGISIYMIEISFPSREREQERERKSYSLSLFSFFIYFIILCIF